MFEIAVGIIVGIIVADLRPELRRLYRRWCNRNLASGNVLSFDGTDLHIGALHYSDGHTVFLKSDGVSVSYYPPQARKG